MTCVIFARNNVYLLNFFTFSYTFCFKKQTQCVIGYNDGWAPLIHFVHEWVYIKC